MLFSFEMCLARSL